MKKILNAGSLILLTATFALSIVDSAPFSAVAQAQSLRLAAYQGGSVVGSWSGTKIENNPSQSGYITLNFNFSFSPDGTYRENAYLGGQKVMSASGSYEQNGERLSFRPQKCTFATPALGGTVKFFPIPTDSPATETVYFSALQGGGQISLKAVGSGDQWGLKPGPEDDSADLAGDTPRAAPADAAGGEVAQVPASASNTSDFPDIDQVLASIRPESNAPQRPLFRNHGSGHEYPRPVA